MKDNRRLRMMALALILLGSGPVPSAAQERPGVRPPPPRAINLPCCRCVDGSTQSISIDTGSAPWTFGPAGGALAPAPVISPLTGGWTTALAPAKWVGPGANAPQGAYTYSLTINVPRCIIPARIAIVGRVAADNSETVLVDGVQIAQYTGIYGFQTPNIVRFNAPPPPLAPGPHTLQVAVHNEGGPSGMVLNGTIRITCPKEPAGPLNVDPTSASPERSAQPGGGDSAF
jgi:hypothetical protein